MKNILFIIGKSQYDSTKVFLEEMITELRHTNISIDLLDIYNEDAYYALRQKLDRKTYDFIFSINAMALETDSSLTKLLLKEPTVYCTMLMDHPLIHHQRLSNQYPYIYVLSPDTNHVDYLKKYYPHIWDEAFFPHGGCKAQSIPPYCDRKIDISFMGSYINPEKTKEDFSRYPLQMRNIMDALCQLLIHNPQLPIETALQHLFDHMGIPMTTNFADILAEFRCVDTYIRSYYRDQVIRSILNAGITIDVYGDGWENMQHIPKKYLKIHPKIEYKKSLEIVADSKISLNVMPWFKAGSHDRIFSAMLCGTVCLTDASRYLSNICTHGENIVFYSLENLQQIPHLIQKILTDTEYSMKIAEKGRIYAEQEHTWAKRSHDFISLLTDAENHMKKRETSARSPAKKS